MRLLIVEDEEKTSSYVHRGLSELGYIVDVATNGIDGLHYALEMDYDVVILDVMLPGKDGYGVLQGLRLYKKTPVIMLSARGTVDDRVRGLREGADDYLAKPFSFAELVARIQALIRRFADDTADPTHLRIDDLEVDLQARKVTRAGVRLDLTAKEFCLLSLLARHQGEILPKLMIAEQVWDMNFDSDANVVEVAIKRVRAKVDAPYPRKLLHTVRGMGYVLESREADGRQNGTP
ncbi:MULTISPECIES: heavy metal response regulator transcription factor [Pseudomonas]|jgi:two-component system copper resistance phosphate regulon response regulator CusR|uniref:Heavy metal response regulator transcription factor n=1 Tax=Pseudomonas bijieensis TaxID=2681983 RepID=A0A6N1C6Q1_9PSED|nr:MULTISPECIES: heavy metal response regulator transcription factor [Pseudomonas]AUM70070.1 DNA-binding response regulator [Pseudomonas fluorescens]AXP03373.1 response regulator [Pseudomonas fluorescens]MDP9782546.1 two-component system copper resistance phosphate regulon response regulator CusR [Pseudomonas fluorescens]PWJ35148.1 two-component system copper resistance phosphate regulon response regulator CusR [Pseudomonas sp. 43mfcvi1.1]QIB08598.1 heavy metal response regulator transcription